MKYWQVKRTNEVNVHKKPENKLFLGLFLGLRLLWFGKVFRIQVIFNLCQHYSRVCPVGGIRETHQTNGVRRIHSSENWK